MRPIKPQTLAFGILAALASAGPAAAQTPKFVSTHRDWTLYEVDGDKGRVCYVASEPTKQEGDYKKRGNPAVLVARLPGEPASEQVSVQPGYNYKKGSEVELAIGKQKFTLFTQGEHAWARTDTDDKALIGAMRKGDAMVIKGTSSKDTDSTDTYSLAGFAPAYDAMREACGTDKTSGGNAGTSGNTKRK
jgi:invasion protein IalB